MIPPQIGELIQKYIDGEIDAGELKTLEDWLKADPANMDAFISHVDVHVRIGSELTAMPDVKPGSVAPHGRSFWRSRPVLSLAAAALLAASVGTVFWLQTRGRAPAGLRVCAMGAVTKQVGQVTITDHGAGEDLRTDVVTGTGSYCRVDQVDKSLIAVDEQSRLLWSRSAGSGQQTVNLESGRTYLDLAAQEKPFLMQVGDLRGEVLGTRILAANGGGSAYVSVLKGSMRVESKVARAVIHGGQTAMPIPGIEGKGVAVFGTPISEKQLAWVDQVGVGFERVRNEAPDMTRRFDRGDINLSMYRVFLGDLKVDYGEDGPVVTQYDNGLDNVPDMAFGDYEWLKGDWSCKARVINIRTNPSIHLVFAYATGGVEGYGVSRSIPTLLAKGDAFYIKGSFEIDDSADELKVNRMEFWPEKSPRDVLVGDNWTRRPGTSSIKKRGPCALGVRAYHCAVEFSDFKLENAVSVKKTRPLAVCRFNEGKGDTIRDVSGIGQPLDLTIKKPECVRWLDKGLEINGNAMMTSKTATKLAEAFRNSNGFTIEFWGRAGSSLSPENSYSPVKFIWNDLGSFVYTQNGIEPDQVGFYAVAFTRKGDGFVMKSFVEAGRETGEKHFDAPWGKMFAEKPFMVEIPLAEDPKGHPGVRSWIGTLYGMKIYDGVLQSEDIKRHYEAEKDEIMKNAAAGR